MPEASDRDLLGALAPDVAAWVERTFGAFTPAQRLALPLVHKRENLLLASPTGSGKTLAAFLGVISDLHRRAAAGTLVEGIHCVYVSPLKALAHDVARNLERPLAEIALQMDEAPDIRVAIRTGDTPQRDRLRMQRAPPHILVTTPESAALVLASKRMRAHLAPLRWLVVDEVHALAGTKRGAHLALTLERLAAHAVAGEPTRIGLSATVAPLPDVAAWLAGDRACAVLEAPPKEPPHFDVRLARGEDEVLDVVAEVVGRSRTTIVFAPTRAATERLTRLLQTKLGEASVEEGEEDADEDENSIDPEFTPPERVPLVAPHHGSMSKDARLIVEERLKRQDLRCVVTSSSLELGVHLDGVDEVVLVGSPKSVARAIQRVGRSNHDLRGTSRGTLVVTDMDDLAEARALCLLARERVVEPTRVPEAPLDVLAQHLVGLAVESPLARADAFERVRRARPYRDLAREDFDDVVAMLTSAEVDLLRVDGADHLVAAGPRALRTVATQGGVIPEGGLVKVFSGQTYVGELDEGFVAALAQGDTFQLAGAAWRFVGAQGLHAHVQPARGEHPTVPAWRAEGLSMTRLLADATRPLRASWPAEPIRKHDSHAKSDTESRWVAYVRRQAAFSALPDAALAVERVVDDSGARALVFHLTRGRRTNEALARALAQRLADQTEGSVRPLASDHGFVLLAPRAYRATRASLSRLFDTPLLGDLQRAVAAAELLKRRFRHVAFRAFLLRYDQVPPGERQRAANMLLARLLRHAPDHPMLAEAWREALTDALDADDAERVRADVASGALPLVLLPQRPHASPMGARILVRSHDAVAGGDREERLLDHDERVDEWLELAAKQDPRP